MTFLLFLASLAVLESILHRDRPGSHHQTEKKEVPLNKTAGDDLAEGPGLLSLAQAVERHGRGETIGTIDHGEAVHKPGADRV